MRHTGIFVVVVLTSVEMENILEEVGGCQERCRYPTTNTRISTTSAITTSVNDYTVYYTSI